MPASGPEELATLTLELVRIPSPSGDEQALADHLCETLVPRLGSPRWRDGNCMVLGARTIPARPVLALVGHLDTVPTPEGLVPRRERDLVHGRGASDMKGGLAVLLALVAEHQPTAAAVDLMAILYDREELPLAENGLRRLLAACPWLAEEVTLAICLEPTAGHVEAGCLGNLHARVRVEGRRAHSARPWEGDNAVHRAAGFIQRVTAWPGRRARVAGLEFRESASVTWIRGGDTRNVIPGECELNLNMRFAPDRAGESILEEARELCAGTATLQVTDLAPAAWPCTDHPWVSRLLEAAGTTLRAKQAWTDVAQLDAAGIPAVNFGPGLPEQAHQDTEHVPVAGLVHSLAALQELVARPPPEGRDDR